MNSQTRNILVLGGVGALLLVALSRRGSGLVKGGRLAQIKPNIRFIEAGGDTYTGGFTEAEVFEGFSAEVLIHVPTISETTRTFWRGVAEIAPDIGFEVVSFPGKTKPTIAIDVPGNTPGEVHPMITISINSKSLSDYLGDDGVPRGDNVQPFTQKFAGEIERSREKYAELLQEAKGSL